MGQLSGLPSVGLPSVPAVPRLPSVPPPRLVTTTATTAPLTRTTRTTAPLTSAAKGLALDAVATAVATTVVTFVAHKIMMFAHKIMMFAGAPPPPNAPFFLHQVSSIFLRSLQELELPISCMACQWPVGYLDGPGAAQLATNLDGSGSLGIPSGLESCFAHLGAIPLSMFEQTVDDMRCTLANC